MASASQTATVAGGCFWCVEPIFEALAGVVSVESGYIGGTMANPDYRAVCSGTTGHAEAVRIVYDPAVISYDALLDIFLHVHDPTQLNRQGADVGTQYRSAIFVDGADDETAARAAIERASGDWPAPIVTTIEPASQWYPAEDYHQRYYDREGGANPYCQMVAAPKIAKFRKAYAALLKP